MRQVGESREYCTVAEAARRLAVSRATVWRWIHSGRLQARRLGPRITRLEESQIESLVPNAGDSQGPAFVEADEDDIWKDYDPVKAWREFERGKGLLASIDKDRLLRDIREGRTQDSLGRPAES